MVVLVTTALVPGGVWRHVRELALGLTELGHRVEIALPAGAMRLSGEARSLGLTTITLRAALLRRSARQHGRRTIFHLHLADTYDRRALGLAIAARVRGLCVVLTEHLPRSNASDTELADRPPRAGAVLAKTLFKRAQYLAAHRVIAVSKGSRSFVMSRYGVTAAKVRVVHNGVPDQAAEPTVNNGWSNGEHLSLVCMASLIQQKGIDVLIDAASRAKGTWTVDVLGDGPHRADLEQRAATSAGGSARVLIRGWSDEIDARLQQADAVVLPSRWEAFPYAALEAMTASRAVVATRVDGVEELVRTGIAEMATGILVPAEDPSALAAALDELSTDPARCARMGSNGRAAVSSFTVEAMVARTEELYDSMAIAP